MYAWEDWRKQDKEQNSQKYRPSPIPNINEANVNKLHLERSGGGAVRGFGERRE